ncbi:hypothetical protein BH10PSE9_BH10PSE9_01690 [soil metagenome]
MSTRFPDDVTLPMHAMPANPDARPARLIAFVPIVIALTGVGAILVGSLSVRGSGPSVAASAAKVDPVTTGSVAPAPPKDIADILRRLDD